jgi:hypothetical protein
MLQAEVFHSIVCCYAQFEVPHSIELGVAVYSELIEGSLTSSLLHLSSKNAKKDFILNWHKNLSTIK